MFSASAEIPLFGSSLSFHAVLFLPSFRFHPVWYLLKSFLFITFTNQGQTHKPGV